MPDATPRNTDQTMEAVVRGGPTSERAA